MNRILAAITLPVAIAAALGLIVGTASGATLAGSPDIKAPHQCTVMANLADGIFVDQRNATEVTHLMNTRGRAEYAEHEAELTRIWGDIDEAYADYLVAKAACLGEDR